MAHLLWIWHGVGSYFFQCLLLYQSVT
jgi:hypothetical protein